MAAIPFKAQSEVSKLPFPYNWNERTPENDFVAGGTATNWKWNSSGYFQIMTTKNNWPGCHMTSAAPFDFKDGQMVTFSFWYYNAVEAELTLSKSETDDNFEEVGKVTLDATGSNWVYYTITFKANGPAKLRWSGIVTGGNGNCYGITRLKDINIASSDADICCVEVQSPLEGSGCAVGSPTPVRAKYENISDFDITNPTFTYSCDGVVISEVYQGTIASHTEFVYSFNTQFVPKSENLNCAMTIGAEIEGDTDTSNNSIEVANLACYNPKEFPYRDNFEDPDYWLAVDANGNGYNWQFGQGSVPHGEYFIGFPLSYGTYDDWAISPAVKMPAGKARLAFYYAGLNSSTHLDIYIGRNTDIAGMKQIVWAEDIDNNYWDCAYAPVDIDEAGNYYFAIHITGADDQVVLTDFRIDAGNDLCIKEVGFNSASGFNISSSQVTLAVANYGIEPQKNIAVSYQIGDDGEQVSETITREIAPGETVTHVFSAPLDVTAVGEYPVIGRILTKVGDDEFNDAKKGSTLKHYANEKLPYKKNFLDESEFEKWQFKNSADKSAWSIATTTLPYIGTQDYYSGGTACVLRHNNQRADGQNSDDWAFSHCIEMEPGVYDFSFFYYIQGDAPRKFGLFLGNDATPEAMTRELMTSDSETMETPEYKKWLQRVEITEAGRYYLGFHSTSAKAEGNILIDNIEIRLTDNGLTLPYTADFEEWEHYNPSIRFLQWTTSEDDTKAVELDRPVFEVLPLYNCRTEGFLVSPLISLKKDCTVEISLDFCMTTNNADGALTLWKSNTNLPADFRAIKKFENAADWTTETYSFDTSESDKDFYIALRSDLPCTWQDDMSENVYSYKIRNLAVKYTRIDGIETVREGNGIIVANRTITAADGDLIELYNLSGILLASSTGKLTIDSPAGIYIVRINGNESRKIVVK